MDTEKYKMGWLLVAFDLPVGTKKQRKAATAFRNFLIDDGYQMVQLSVYARACVSFARQETHLDRVRKNLPPEGSVRAIFVTRAPVLESRQSRLPRSVGQPTGLRELPRSAGQPTSLRAPVLESRRGEVSPDFLAAGPAGDYRLSKAPSRRQDAARQARKKKRAWRNLDPCPQRSRQPARRKPGPTG